ncbi:MAG: hypothetical protein Q7T50_05655, partial [Candidatus Magasanikbacteria bacterium]|nr:hypothetical protein [Candidatus Magasanikbacteria bacterium]
HINFDKEAGIYFFGKNNPKTISATQNMQPNNSLGNIKETQIISKFVRGKKSNGFTCYEFNIVLQDNQRFNVLNHSNYRKIFEDAEKLSSFLNVPLSKTDAPKNPVINF